MSGWELIPPGSDDIYESKQFGERKVIGQFTHCRVDRNGVLIGLRVKDGPEMRIYRNKIAVEGYMAPWYPVCYMDTNESKKICAMWAWQLICEGKFESHRSAQDAPAT